MRAAQYVRMSTEHQQYSIANQKGVIAEYARLHGFEVVQTYVDAGISGLDLAHRPGLRQLLDDVFSHRAEFTAVLVYDVSRWGRFQDADESAHYEFLCKQSGIQVHYCAEQFPNDNSLLTSLCKALKRTMAAEFSRELSVKSFAGQVRLTQLGFKMGGQPGYGLRRMLIGTDGTPLGELHPGEWKYLSTQRVILVPGPQHETDVVQKIFSMYGKFALSTLMQTEGTFNADKPFSPISSSLCPLRRRPWAPLSRKYQDLLQSRGERSPRGSLRRGIFPKFGADGTAGPP